MKTTISTYMGCRKAYSQVPEDKNVMTMVSSPATSELQCAHRASGRKHVLPAYGIAMRFVGYTQIGERSCCR